MSGNFLRIILIPAAVFVLIFLTRLARKYLSKPEETDGVQKPGKFIRFWVMVIRILAYAMTFFAIIGAVMREVEMGLVFLVLTIIFFGLLVLVKRKFDTSYQENEEYFLLKIRKKDYKVYYNQIEDWQPNLYEIIIFDKTRADGEPIPIDLEMFNPEILLQKIVAMTFEGKFTGSNEANINESKREQTIVNFLIQNNYGYLVEDEVEEDQ